MSEKFPHEKKLGISSMDDKRKRRGIHLSPSNLIINRTCEDEMLLQLDLMQVASLASPIGAWDVVISVNLKPMRAYSELSKEDPKVIQCLCVYTGLTIRTSLNCKKCSE